MKIFTNIVLIFLFVLFNINISYSKEFSEDEKIFKDYFKGSFKTIHSKFDLIGERSYSKKLKDGRILD